MRVWKYGFDEFCSAESVCVIYDLSAEYTEEIHAEYAEAY
jgi:hypothetical protein